MIYFFVFFMSCIFTHMAHKAFDKNKKRLGIILSLIAILIPSVLAGLRDTTVGTDVDYYLTYDLQVASAYSNFIQYYNFIGEELFFALLVFLSNKIFNNINVLMFIIQFIMTSLVYIELYRQKDRFSMWLGMTIYFTFAYPRFLNLIRQGIAVSIVIFSMRYIENRKLSKFLITILVAILFHRTAIFALPLYYLYTLTTNKNSNNTAYLMMFYIILIVGVGIYDSILEKLVNIGLLPNKYDVYLNKYMKKIVDFDLFTAIYKGIWILWLIIVFKNIKEIDKNSKFYLNLLLLDLILWEMNYKIANAERLSYYYGLIANMSIFPQIPKTFKKDSRNQTIIYLMIMALCIFYWWWKFIYFHSGEIYPYKLGI